MKVNIEVFVVDSRGKRASCGEYEAEIENYRLSVDMRRKLDLRDILFIEIEFKGKGFVKK